MRSFFNFYNIMDALFLITSCIGLIFFLYLCFV